MSERYPGGIISKNPVVPSGPYQTSTASGTWTLDQQAYWKAQNNWPTTGNEQLYVEDVFSTWLYTGNGTTQTITNSIDLATYGGLVWQKDRVSAGQSHILCDTARGVNSFLRSDLTSAAGNNGGTDAVYAFNSNGFSTGTVNGTSINLSGDATVAWTFRKQPKFFDIVTWSGNDTAGRTISHSLGSVPGMIIVKATSRTSGWTVYHRSTGATQYLNLNTTAAAGTTNIYWNDTAPTSTVFTVGNSAAVNGSGETYVAYLFAHDAGGFGTTGTDNVISCSGFTSDGSGNATVNLGYEPQYVMYKRSSGTSDWLVFDVMRGMSLTSGAKLNPNTATAEASNLSIIPTATGFNLVNYFASSDYIYMAIRRPMKVPTDATTVFKPVVQGFDGFVNTGFVTDLIFGNQYIGSNNWRWVDRLRGQDRTLFSNLTSSEGIEPYWKLDYNTGVNLTYGGTIPNWVWSNFRRAPGFFDTVCYTGTGSATTQAHNLGVVPELMIFKKRSGASNWSVYSKSLSATDLLYLSYTNGASTDTSVWNSTAPTSSVFSVGTSGGVNTSGGTYVAYLFATCAGVSKVGTYTGNGTTQAISCGFTGGARFVLIKRTDAAGDWYVYNTARGMTTLTDPYLLLNTGDAEVATLGSVTTTAGGFTLNAAILAAINTNGASYIFLAIA